MCCAASQLIFYSKCLAKVKRKKNQTTNIFPHKYSLVLEHIQQHMEEGEVLANGNICI